MLSSPSHSPQIFGFLFFGYFNGFLVFWMVVFGFFGFCFFWFFDGFPQMIGFHSFLFLLNDKVVFRGSPPLSPSSSHCPIWKQCGERVRAKTPQSSFLLTQTGFSRVFLVGGLAGKSLAGGLLGWLSLSLSLFLHCFLCLSLVHSSFRVKTMFRSLPLSPIPFLDSPFFILQAIRCKTFTNH